MNLFRRSPIRQTVRVHTRDGATFEGVLAHDGRRYLVLDHAARLTDKGERVDLSGRSFMPRENVHFVQAGWS